MRRRLPPLNAVRAFEAAARHLSFRRAAEELYVTPAAVSQQVRLLEDCLGHTLFERRTGGGLTLTQAGDVCNRGLRGVFDELANIFGRLESDPDHHSVTVLLPPSLCVKWLVPRLPAFHALYPEITVHLLPNLVGHFREPDDHDLAIYYARGTYAGLEVETLMPEVVFPVCSPKLIRDHQPLQSPEDLRHHNLLHDDTMQAAGNHAFREFPTWQGWIDAAGVRGVDTLKGTHLQMSSTVTDAAIAGAGVALGRSCIVHDAIQAGDLVRPFTFEYPRRFAYLLVWPPSATTRRSVCVFKEWLTREASAASQCSFPPDAGGATPVGLAQ